MILETEELLKRWQNGDKEARNKLVEENMGLVRHIVRRYQGRGYDLEDLVQIGSIGLLKAIDKFDLSFQVCFSTYAVPMINGEIRRFLRDDGLLKISRTVKENSFKVKRAMEAIAHREGRDATFHEIEQETMLSKDEILMAMEAGVDVTSIYQSVYQKDGNEIYLLDQIVSRDHHVTAIYETPASKEMDFEKEELLNHLVLSQMMERLKDEEKALIKLRYFEEKTQVEVAKIMGLTQVKVSRLEKKILCKMREEILQENNKKVLSAAKVYEKVADIDNTK